MITREVQENVKTEKPEESIYIEREKKKKFLHV